jgi:hypothetical protein
MKQPSLIEVSLRFLECLPSDHPMSNLIKRNIAFLKKNQDSFVEAIVRILLDEHNTHRYSIDLNNPDNGTDYYAITSGFSSLAGDAKGQDFAVCVFWHSIGHLGISLSLDSVLVDLLVADMVRDEVTDTVLLDIKKGTQTLFEYVGPYASYSKQYQLIIDEVLDNKCVFNTGMDLSFVRMQEITFDKPHLVLEFDVFLKQNYPQFYSIHTVSGR